jgi:hypothetical protein
MLVELVSILLFKKMGCQLDRSRVTSTQVDSLQEKKNQGGD